MRAIGTIGPAQSLKGFAGLVFVLKHFGFECGHRFAPMPTFMGLGVTFVKYIIPLQGRVRKPPLRRRPMRLAHMESRRIGARKRPARQPDRAGARTRRGRRNVRYRCRRNSRRRRRTPASAARSAGEERAGRWADPAHAVVAGMAERDRALSRHLRGDRGDLLYRPARRRVAGGDGAGVPVRDPDHDDVGRRDGRRRGVGDRACARRRRHRPRLDAGGACAADRHHASGWRSCWAC